MDDSAILKVVLIPYQGLSGYYDKVVNRKALTRCHLTVRYLFIRTKMVKGGTNMGYGIGLDIGIASVGWAVVALDFEENPWGIIKIGSRIFDAAEQPKTGASLAKPRRDARGARRRLRRRHHRLERIKNLLISAGILTAEELENLFRGQLEDIYQLRTRALDTVVNKYEFARILLHLAQRRGFRSNRKADKADKEAGQLLTAVSENMKRMEANGYRTVGEMFFKDATFKDNKRNKSASYLAVVQRDMIAAEVEAIFTSQQLRGSVFATEELKASYLDILLSQRPFDLGPGGDSPYGGNQIEKMISACTLENQEGDKEERAAKACYSFEYFNLLQKVNHLRLVTQGVSVPLTPEQRKRIIELAHGTADLSYKKIRKELGIPLGTFFNSVFYRGDTEECEKKEKLNYLKAYHEMRKAFDKIAKGHISTLSREKLNIAGRTLTVFKTDTKIIETLQKADFAQEDMDALLTLTSFSKFGHLSVKACDKLIPFLEEGMNYDQACTAAGYDFRGHNNTAKAKLLPAQTEDMEAITSPVVRRAVAQTIKVINAIIRDQGVSPTFINIELARELAKNFEERKKSEKENKENQAQNERLMERIRKEFGKTHPTGLDLVKLKLYEEQAGICVYSQRSIIASRLFEPGYVEVDHIIPYSKSFDDTYKNKVLVFSRENQHKGNRLPLEYMKAEQRDKFKVWVNNNVKNYRKKQILLKEKLTAEDENKFKERNLQDTKTMSRFLYNYIRDYLEFAPSATGKIKRVTPVNGAITAHMRKRWGINKNRADGDLHHAVDALVIACTTDKMIQEVSRYSKRKEMEFMQDENGGLVVNTRTGEILKKFPLPWPDFRKELEARLSPRPAEYLQMLNLSFYRDKNLEEIKPIFVSRMPKHKVTGAAHKDTIKGVVGEGILVLKKELTTLKLNKEGEIDDYFAPESDRLLYEALKEKLIAAGGDGKKAFAEPFYKPKSDGSPGHLVRKVKIMEKSSLNVPVHQGTAVAANDSMIRIDVFQVAGDGYYAVPIYVADALKTQLPNKAIVANKPYAEWKEMQEEDFLFSVYPSDLLKVTHKKGMKFVNVSEESSLAKEYTVKEEMVYYNSTGIAVGSMKVINHNNTFKIESLGIKSLANLEKYQVDVLGNYYQVKGERRQQINFATAREKAEKRQGYGLS